MNQGRKPAIRRCPEPGNALQAGGRRRALCRADMTQQKNTVEACVDTLCEQGCSRVNACISALQNGEDVPEVAGLSVADRQVVLQQLVAIMAVYDGSCDS